MRRRRSSILDAIDAFNAAYDTTTRVAKDIELSKVANAKFEESQGYTQDQGDQLRAAAESGQYDIGIKTKEDGTFDSYTVTPKADPSQTGTIAMQGVTDFLGERTAGRMNQDQRDRARQMAMAGVLEKYDPQEGMRLRREVKAQERDDARWDRQTKTWEREDRDQAKRDEYETARQQLFGQTRFAQTQAQYQQQMAEYQRQLEAWKQNPTGPQPVAPTRPEYSIGDSLADRAMLIDHDAKYGRLDARTFGEFVDLMQRVQGEGYEKALRLAQSGAPRQEVIKAFNGTGKVQADPANIVSDKMVKRPDGVTTRVIQYKDAQGNVRTLDTVAELDALGKASEVFTRFYQGRQDARAERADARADARFYQDQADRKTKKEEEEAQRQASYNLWLEQNPNATEAQKAAARQQILKPRTGEGGEITSDYKPDAVGMGGTAIQKDKAGNLVVTKIGPDGKVGQPMVIRPPGSDSTPKFASMAEAEAAVKAGKIKPGDRVTIGGRTAVWMPDAAAPAPARSSPASQPVASPAPVAQTPPSAPPQAAAPRSVASVPGAGNTQDSALNAILASKAKAIESAASDLKTAQAQFAAAARSGDQAATAEYQRRVVAAQQRLNAVLGSMNEAQAAQVRRSLGI